MKKILTVIFAAVAVLLIAVFALTLKTSGGAEEFFSNYSSNFSKNVSGIIQSLNISLPHKTDSGETQQATDDNDDEDDEDEYDDLQTIESKDAEIKNSKVVAIKEASNMKYAVYKEELICSDQNSVMAIDSTGENLWALPITAQNPILKTAGDYILVAEKGGTKIHVLIDKDVKYSINTENEIITADISQNGDVVAVTKKPDYHGAVVVYNKEGENIYIWNSGINDIVDADISDETRNIAVALLDTSDSVKGIVQLFDINKEEYYAAQEFDDTVIFDVQYIGDTINAVGDNRIAGISAKGRLISDKSFDGQTLSQYNLSETGFKTLVFDRGSASQIQILNAKFKEKVNIKSEYLPKIMVSAGNNLVYDNQSALILGNFTGKNFKKYRTEQDIKDIVVINSNNVVIVYNNSLEFCEF